MADLFTPDQIETLRSQYARLKTVDPEGPAYRRLCTMLDGLPDTVLLQVSKAGIKFVSTLAINRCVRRGI